jgi:hypothetical protein
MTTQTEGVSAHEGASLPAESGPPFSIPTRTLPLLTLLLTVGLVILAFTYFTVHRRTAAELASNSNARRTNFSITYWVEHGYFSSFGLLVRSAPAEPGVQYYLSSTGGHLVSGFLLEKAVHLFRGHTSAKVLAFHNQIITLIAAALLGLLGFRLAQRMGMSAHHALLLAVCVEAVHFTFPDNLTGFWELAGRQPFLLFATLFLLIEERSLEGRTRQLTILQGIAAFLATYMEYLAGLAFLASWVMVSLMLRRDRVSVKKLLAITIFPALLALSLFGAQRLLLETFQPKAPTTGSDFFFRSGLDGSSQYYGDHLDIAYRRDIARGNWPQNRPYLFRWQWLFFAGTAALVTILIFGARGRIPELILSALLALLGSYVLYGALFSQAFVIHPYLFDVLLFTPLVLAVFVIAPAFFESMTAHRGVFVAAVFFVAVWLCMVQLRHYALMYPLAPEVTAAKP